LQTATRSFTPPPSQVVRIRTNPPLHLCRRPLGSTIDPAQQFMKIKHCKYFFYFQMIAGPHDAQLSVSPLSTNKPKTKDFQNLMIRYNFNLIIMHQERFLFYACEVRVPTMSNVNDLELNFESSFRYSML